MVPLDKSSTSSSNLLVKVFACFALFTVLLSLVTSSSLENGASSNSQNSTLDGIKNSFDSLNISLEKIFPPEPKEILPSASVKSSSLASKNVTMVKSTITIAPKKSKSLLKRVKKVISKFFRGSKDNKKTPSITSDRLSVDFRATSEMTQVEIPNNYLLRKIETDSEIYQLSVIKGTTIKEYIELILKNFPSNLLTIPLDETKITEELKERFKTPSNDFALFELGKKISGNNIAISVFEFCNLLFPDSEKCQEKLSCLIQALFSRKQVFSVLLPNAMEEYVKQCSEINSDGQSTSISQFMKNIFSKLVGPNHQTINRCLWIKVLDEICSYGFKGNSFSKDALTKLTPSEILLSLDVPDLSEHIDLNHIEILFANFQFIRKASDLKLILKDYVEKCKENLKTPEEIFTDFIIDGKLNDHVFCKPQFTAKYLLFEVLTISSSDLSTKIKDELKKQSTPTLPIKEDTKSNKEQPITIDLSFQQKIEEEEQIPSSSMPINPEPISLTTSDESKETKSSSWIGWIFIHAIFIFAIASYYVYRYDNKIIINPQ